MRANKNLTVVLGVLAVALLLPMVASSQNGVANAADKAAVSGSTIELLSPGGTVTALSATIKTSSTVDLIFSLTAECALWTSVSTSGNDMSEASAAVEAWLEVDGVVVPVGGAGAPDGHIVMCNRVHGQVTSMFDDEDARIQQYMNTRQANGFNWALLDVGSGDHTVELKVAFETHTTEGAFAQAGVGARTLVIEPTRLPHGATIQF